MCPCSGKVWQGPVLSESGKVVPDKVTFEVMVGGCVGLLWWGQRDWEGRFQGKETVWAEALGPAGDS